MQQKWCVWGAGMKRIVMRTNCPIKINQGKYRRLTNKEINNILKREDIVKLAKARVTHICLRTSV